MSQRGAGGRGGRGGRGRGGGPRGGGPRGGGPRGGSPAPLVGGGGPAFGAPARGGPQTGLPSANVTTTGVRRTEFGQAGRAIQVYTNHFEVDIPKGIIYHYDVAMSPSESGRPVRLNMAIIRRLQEDIAPHIFTPRAVYDGRKNMFSARELPFTNERDSQTFDVTLNDPNPNAPVREGARGPRVHKVTLTKVATINNEVLSRFLEGKQSHDNTVLTAITALNVVVRMEPTSRWPFNVRSFFTDAETKNIGSGIVLWRGYFQSVRPAIGRMLINIDISTAAMHQAGPLLTLCLNFLGQNPANPQVLAQASGFPDRERARLQRHITGIRITTTTTTAQQGGLRNPRVIKKLTGPGANALSFTTREGQSQTVSQYFQRTYNKPLRFPTIPCVEVGNGALIPLEVCEVVPGQIMKRQVPSHKTKDVVEFATKHPVDRLNSIRAGLGVLSYGQSEYVRQFGLNVKEAQGPLLVNARILTPPTLKYGAGKQPTVVPRDGAWNMIEKQFYKPSKILIWGVVIYERQQRFNQNTAREMVAGLVSACEAVGIQVIDKDPIINWENPQGRITDQLRKAGQDCQARKKGFPNLLVVILPDGGDDIWTAVKHFGDITAGVATQCMKSSKCSRAKAQYFANVCLKINVKLGGINTIPDPRSVQILTDPHNPTIVMGADVIHPPPGSDSRPSFTALVANVDSDTAKYIADCRVQTSRQEMIDDLEAMAQNMLEMYMRYRKNVEKKANGAPSRIIFYRDGVSEGQFSQVLELELPRIQQACQNLGINPKITVIVVGKRHHVRFFPKTQQEGDRKSGNCFAGTVIDRDIVHPTETDFYLQSHAGILGTSRPAHYNVLYDDFGFKADAIQALSFALCHVYARSTRSVSIPAPVYYADIVCSRAKTHYDPASNLDLTETGTVEGTQAGDQLEAFKAGFRPLHNNMRFVMYFS